MRFGIRDLLLLTTAASVYAAVAGAVLANGGFHDGPGDRLNVVIWIAAWAYLLFSMRRKRKKAGIALLSFTRWYRGWAHGTVMVMSLGGPLATLFEPDVKLRLAVLMLPPMLYHTLIEGSATVSFTETGVYTGKLRRWEDWRFELRPSTSELVGCPDPNPHRIAPLVVRVPADRLKEVGEFLIERQTSIEEPA